MSEEDGDALVLLRTLIDLLLHEARLQTDYRSIFPFLTRRINVHVIRLLEQTDPVVVGEMVFVNMSAVTSSSVHNQHPPCHQSAVLYARVEHPCAHVPGPTLRMQAENGAWMDDQGLLKRAGARLVRDADLKGIGL